MTDGSDHPATGPGTLRTGDVVLDLRGYELRRAGERVHVEPQVFDVIRYLVEHAGRVVPKEELLDNVWGTRFVSESSLTTRIKAARRALGDDGREQRIIQTVHGRGYRWVATFEPTADPATRTPASETSAPALPASVLPVSLTAFIGRRQELDALVAAARANRLVTATGPGGIGKTRLALAAAGTMAAELRDGVAFADLVEVTEPSMVVAAVADAAGVPDLAGTNRRDALHAALAGSERLFVVDNCEHVLDGVRTCIEDLLVACPEVRVLATSRIRLMLPYEHVYAVPGLSIDGDDPTVAGDAVELFTARMVAAGSPAPDGPAELEHVRRLCRSLDGMALAIELAAARVPSLGLDGLATALGAELSLLSTGRTTEHRHRSLHAAIDWTYRLLDDHERATLRAASVFAVPFDVDALATVMGEPLTPVLDSVARLVDWNLAARQPGGRFRVLETIRQFAIAQADDEGEHDTLRGAHLAWVRATMERLIDRVPANDATADGTGERTVGSSFDGARDAGVDAWCADVDLVLPDARAALRWAIDLPGPRAASGFADLLASVCYQRGHPGEAQRRYQDAAAAALDADRRHRSLRLAAGAAAARNVGAEALDLLEEAAAAAMAAGRPDDAAVDLATAAMYCNRASGIIARPISVEVTEGFLAAARDASTGAAPAEAAIAVAAGWGPESVARSLDVAREAVALARGVDDRLLESAALDLLSAAQLDDLDEAVKAVRRRRELLAEAPLDARGGFELYDTYHMSCQIDLARGDFAAARRHAEVITAMPFFREARHIGLGRRMEVDALAGEFDAVVRYGEVFERDWAKAGRPGAGNLAVGAYAVAMVHGILGHRDQRSRWIEIARSLIVPDKHYLLREAGWAPTLDAFLALHEGDPDEALARLVAEPDDPASWRNPNRGLWRRWYAAAWTEASVLAGLPDVASRLERGARAACGNGVAELLVERARLVHLGDSDAVRAMVRRFDEAGAVYQAARTLELADGRSAGGL